MVGSQIDSLCIVQDDHDDWAHEASKMSTVYHNAFVTISATASRSGEEGLFRSYTEYEVELRSGRIKAATLIFCEKRSHMDEFSDPLSSARPSDKFPLNKRAWGLQERLLSTRVLHYTYSELAFECMRGYECECSGVTDMAWNSFTQAPKTSMRTDLPLPEYREVWKTIVSQYSHRQLTYSGDKLVAIAGLAKRFAKPDDRYIAGLWRSNLREQLQWRATRPRLRSKLAPRPTWRAPSWSWAAVDTSIEYMDSGAHDSSYMGSESETSFAKILDCYVEPKATDLYGELRSGMLRLLGRCTPVVWGKAHSKGSGRDRDYITFPNRSDRLVRWDTSDVSAHAPGTPLEDSDLTCIFFSVSSSYRTALVLRRLESGKDVFVRVGMTWEGCGLNITAENIDNLFPSEKSVVEII